MFKSVRTYQFAMKNAEKLVESHQFCVDCNKWFPTTEPLRAALIADREAEAKAKAEGQQAFGRPFNNITCPHCKARQILVDPGKYDGLHSKRPAVQRYTFAT